MAVVGVGRELVCAVRSLICRENTGNLARFEHRGGRLGRESSADPPGWNGIPYELEQGSIPSEQGMAGTNQRVTAS